jgi:hypothetical protein
LAASIFVRVARHFLVASNDLGAAFGIAPGSAEGIVTSPKNDKHKKYAQYAAHCLDMVTVTKDQDSRDIQREMAIEWLRLADTIAHPLKPMK